MKKVYLIHGWDGSPDEPMHVWLKNNLDAKGFEVIAPLMPNPETPKITEWLEKLQQVVGVPDESTFFVAHSIGCQAILRYLATLSDEVKVGGMFFIAPWMFLNQDAIAEEGEDSLAVAREWENPELNWDKLRTQTQKIVCIFSDNDPFVLAENQKIFADNLGAKIIIESSKGHFTEEDGVVDNPTIAQEIIKYDKF